MAESPTKKMLGKKVSAEETPTTEEAATVTETKPVDKPKAAAKPKAAPAEKKEVVPDLIADTSHEIETMTKDNALEEVRNLINAAEFNFFKIGGILSVIQANGWWQESVEDNFKTFVENVYGIAYRKAIYWIAIYNALVESGVAWDSVKDVGWTKLKEIAQYLTTENVAEWVSRAKKMTTIQLQEYIKSMNSSDSPAGDGPETEASKTSSMTFKVHEDQKMTIRDAIDKSKADNNTEYDAVALEFICMQYLEGTLGAKKSAKKQSLPELLGDHTPEQILEVFSELYPDIDIEVAL